MSEIFNDVEMDSEVDYSSSTDEAEDSDSTEESFADDNEKKVLITHIKFERIILCIQGNLFNYPANAKIAAKLYSSAAKCTVYPQDINISDGKFEVKFNVLAASNELPMKKGKYILVFSEKVDPNFDERTCTLNPEIGTVLVIEENEIYKEYYDEADFFINAELLSKENRAFISPEYIADPEYIVDPEYDEIEEENSFFSEAQLNLFKSKTNFFSATSIHDDIGVYNLIINCSIPSALPVPYWRKKRLERKTKRQKKRKQKETFRTTKKNQHYLFGARFLFDFFYKFAKKKGNVVLITSASRSEIGGNEEIIYKRMLERGMGETHKFLFDFVPSITDKRTVFEKIMFFRKLALADIIMIDDYFPDIYKIDYPAEKKVVQVWHACGAFKSLGLERLGKAGAPPYNTRVHKCYTHMPVSSYHSALHHSEAFAIDINKFYPIGIPRTDIFFDENYKANIVTKMEQEFPQIVGKNRVYLYAPTFRGENALNAHFPFRKIDINRLGEFCKENNALVILKMHPFVTQHIKIPEIYQDCIIDATSYREVNDILFIVDVLITDYSSVIYEFSLLRRPMLFYAFDGSSYIETRDFYEPYEDIVPGKIVNTFDELLSAMENEDYQFDKIDSFIHKNFTHTDSKSTDRFIDQIILDKKEEQLNLD